MPTQTASLPSGRILFGEDAAFVLHCCEQLEALRKELEQIKTAIGNEQLARFIEKHGNPVPIVQELERVKGERDALLIACKRALNYANHVGEAEGVLFDNDGDIPAIAAAIAAQGEQ